MTLSAFLCCALTEAAEETWPCEICMEKIPDISNYFYKKMEILSDADELTAKKCPDGYSGKVIVTAQREDVGVTFDFTKSNIRTKTIEEIRIRYAIPKTKKDDDKYPQLQLFAPHASGYRLVRDSVGSTAGTWCELVLKSDGTGFYSHYKALAGDGNAFDSLADENGYLTYFELNIERVSGSVGRLYIDDISIKLKDDNGKAPELTAPSGDLFCPLGSNPCLGFTAYDNEEKCDCDVTYAWASGKAPTEKGSADVIVSASDSYGNKAEKKVSVKITDPDKTAPTFKIKVDTIEVPVNTIPLLDPTADDNYGSATVEASWSEGALDALGRLTAGEHTYTIKATDDVGNSAVKEIKFKVA